ncbi:MAG TPA: Sapep family Mn(2+)-dependent dipeptidase [Holophagaceae bacterium]|jgi:predicted dipeptidase|nr:Sapep family Mn(2+)-dependent dipeptidase [Holophagaceae bacterium]
MRQLALAALSVLSLSAQDSARVWKRYQKQEAPKLLPWLQEVIRFPTVAGNTQAWTDQKAWLQARAQELGFAFKDTGAVFEIELPGSEGVPVIGLVIHGDVQPVEASRWSFPPFAGTVKDGSVIGRGAADDKGPLVQALLAMKALKESGLPRTHTLRMLVGSDEESGSTDMGIYLKDHKAPDYSLVLDSGFPVVVGEKAWNALWVQTTPGERPGRTEPYTVESLNAGLSPSIVPDQAKLVLHWKEGTADWTPLMKRLSAKPLPPGTHLQTKADGASLVIATTGKSAHGGVNLEGGRNALLALASVVKDELPSGGADDLLAFARQAGSDLYGDGLGLTEKDPLWGRAAVNVAMAGPSVQVTRMGAPIAGDWSLLINIRTPPPLFGKALHDRMDAQVAAFNARAGATLITDGYYLDTPLVFDPQAKLVKRLMADYAKATGEHPAPAISGGGTYAKRIPNAIAFGMWFPDKPYPGHDVDEKVPVADLERGEKVLIEALVDLACGAPLADPFKP